MPDDRTRCSDDARDAVWDDYVLGGLLVVLGGLRVLIAFAEHERFGTEATLAVIAVLAGAVVLVLAPGRLTRS